MKNLKKIHLLILSLSIFLISSIGFAQDGAKTRSITSDDFASQRPVNKISQTGKNSRVKPRRATYKYVRRNNTVKRKNTVRRKPQTATAKQPEKISEIGVNIWKLRPPIAADKGYKLPVLINNLREMWTAERVSGEIPFRKGDRVRIAVESSVSGYLYVVNSEIFSDGSFGEPYLIFPAGKNDDNSIEPGLLVDIPDQTEDFPYFIINPKTENYAGELLTVVISPKPLTDLKTDDEGKIINLDELIELELNADNEIFSRTDKQDSIYSQAEASAACGAKTRQLTRVKLNEQPCGGKSRQLTREEPLPQTIYRVKTVAGQPAVALINLLVN
ncbi:hypothetical protein BH20ACI4_BH20ACI4_28460 [soil metagenome]